MRKTKFLGIVVGGLFLLYGSCQKNDIVELNDCNLENIIKSANNSKGTIWYDTLSQSYSVFTGVEGTYDSQDIGITCNLPDDYQTEGLKILFNGNYYSCEEFSPLIPGQTYYYLEITKIKPLSEE